MKHNFYRARKKYKNRSELIARLSYVKPMKIFKGGRKVKIETSGDFVVRLFPEAWLYSFIAAWPWARQALFGFSLSESVH